MKKLILFIALIAIHFKFLAQESIKLSGTVKDALNGETLIGAAIIYQENKGTITDIFGNYSLDIAKGEYLFKVSYVGYESITKIVKIENKNQVLNFSLQVKSLDEIEIVADVAKTRETPIAFSNLSIKQIREELGTRDLVTLLNGTPGVYVTETGGGSGDARVSIRGFDQRNIAVLVDGMPVNDMESGRVFWSNWDGLGDIVRNVQVQRGLGASKLAVASVGGTMNTITKGIESRPEITVRKDVSSVFLQKTSIVFNTGLLKGGWGLTGAFSKKYGDGYVDQTWTDAYSYFLKIQKRLGNHLLSFSGSGAPQKHGQRSSQLPIAVFDTKLAEELGVDSIANYGDNNILGRDNGIRFNPSWGFLNGKKLNERVNYFHKPQLNLSHFWTINDNLSLSNVVYASYGKGGGTSFDKSANFPRDSVNNAYLLDQLFMANSSLIIDQSYSPTEHLSSNFIKSSINNHRWYGLLSSINYKVDENISTFFGVDLRTYVGDHYREVHNLLGGDYTTDPGSDKNQPQPEFPNDPRFQSHVRRKGDKIEYNYQGFVKWGGFFGQVEYKKDNFSVFATASASQTQYQRKDYYAKKDLILADTTLIRVMGYRDEVIYNDVVYNRNSPEARTSITDVLKLNGFTIKGGSNYNINRHHNVYLNMGYLRMPPRFNLLFLNSNQIVSNPKMQNVKSFELGYRASYKKLAANVNLYYTIWENKPLNDFATIRNSDGDFTYDAALDALHKGVEIDGIYKFSTHFELEGLISFGDWINTSSGSFVLNPIDDPSVIYDTVVFSAKNVHVGDAAQIQYGGSFRYNFGKGGFLKIRAIKFEKNYANADLYTLRLEEGTNSNDSFDNRDRESWKMPNYLLVDFFAGFTFVHSIFTLRPAFGVTNLLNSTYISDATNGTNFDAASAVVFIGAGRRFNASLSLTF